MCFSGVFSVSCCVSGGSVCVLVAVVVCRV